MRENRAMADQHNEAPAAGAASGTEHGAARPKARDLNQLIRYTMWSAFRVSDRAALDLASRDGLAAEVAELCEQAAGKDVITRGSYDLQGLRADADLMFWWIAPTSDDLQEMYARFRRTRLGRACEPVWSAMTLHRPAEFNKSHIPAFLAGEAPKNYVCVYPFVRSYEWYLLDDGERRWMLAFEADELHRIVDLMRHLRGAAARRHTRVEIPFYTGRRKPIGELVASLA